MNFSFNTDLLETMRQEAIKRFCESLDNNTETEKKTEIVNIVKEKTHIDTISIFSHDSCIVDSNDNNSNPVCPILLKKIKVPAVTSDGFVFEKSEISRWLEKNTSSPITNLPISNILYPLFVQFGTYSAKSCDPHPDNQSIIIEKTKRIIDLENMNKNLRGIQTYIKNYNPLFETRLDHAKEISQNNKFLSHLIQTHVTMIISSDANIKENARKKLDDELEKNKIMQVGNKHLYNFSCLPLEGMRICGTSNYYNFQYADLRNVIFEGEAHTGGCLHANYTGADMTNSISVGDFCTKNSKYMCCNMTDAKISGLNMGMSEFSGAIIIGTEVMINDVIINLSDENVYKICDEPSIDSIISLNQLNEIKTNIKKNMNFV